MSQNQPISLEALQTETDKFLSWIEEHKIRGFVGDEIKYFSELVKECIQKENFYEIIKSIKEEIRKWLCADWNPTILGKKYKQYKNHTPRAEVITVFPELLTNYMKTLSNSPRVNPENEEASISNERELTEELEKFQQIILRFEVSMILLTTNEPQNDEIPVKKKKSKHSKHSRGDK